MKHNVCLTLTDAPLGYTHAQVNQGTLSAITWQCTHREMRCTTMGYTLRTCTKPEALTDGRVPWLHLCTIDDTEDDAIHTAMLCSMSGEYVSVTHPTMIAHTWHTYCIGVYLRGELLPETTGYVF